MSVRKLEVDLTGLEDRISKELGYREYQVYVGDTLLEPPPNVDQKKVDEFSPKSLDLFQKNLQGNTSPIGFFKLKISRLIPESLIRDYQYWDLIRDNIKSSCLPVSITVEDSRYIVILAVIKNSKVNVSLDEIILSSNSLVPGDNLNVQIKATNYPNSVIRLKFSGGLRVEHIKGNNIPTHLVTDGNSNASFDLELKSDITSDKTFSITVEALNQSLTTDSIQIVI